MKQRKMTSTATDLSPLIWEIEFPFQILSGTADIIKRKAGDRSCLYEKGAIKLKPGWLIFLIILLGIVPIPISIYARRKATRKGFTKAKVNLATAFCFIPPILGYFLVAILFDCERYGMTFWIWAVTFVVSWPFGGILFLAHRLDFCDQGEEDADDERRSRAAMGY